MTLQDKRVVVTRAPHQAIRLVDMLRDQGAIPLIYPCIDVAPPQNVNPFDAALRNLHLYDWLIITSSNTVLAMKRRFQVLQIRPDLAHIKIAAVGESTAEAILSMFGAEPQIVPEEQSALGLSQIMSINDGTCIFLPQSSIARTDLADYLRQQGASVTVADAYQTVIGSGGEDIPQMLREGRVDAVTFTSSSTVDNFVARISPESAASIPAACIGSLTADTAVQKGFQQVLVPDRFALDDMVTKLSEFFN